LVPGRRCLGWWSRFEKGAPHLPPHHPLLIVAKKKAREP
jgi:hypothetical protein